MSKRMKICALVLMIIIFTTTMGFSSSENEEEIVAKLVTERIDAMNLYYSSQINEYEAKQRLKAVESGILLEDDIENLHTYFRTDIEEVKTYTFDEIDVTSSDSDVICAKVSIDWAVEGLAGSEAFCCCYSVICENEGEGFKLVQFYG